MIPLIARQVVEHDGRTYQPGESFSASPTQAAALTYQHKAEFADGSGKAGKKTSRKPSKGRTYKRRDMTAEGE